MKLHLTLVLLLAISAPAMAGRYISNGGGNTDVVVDMPREVGTTPPACQHCCIYDNRNYSEGAVLKSEGVLLQCVRDENTLGTNNLIWRTVK